MNLCPRCHGDGYVFGHWMPEVCPECGDDPANVPATVNEPAPGVDSFLKGALIVGAVAGIAILWRLWEFYAAVFR